MPTGQPGTMARTGLAAGGAGHPLVGLVTRFMTAQTVCSAAVGLFYSRRHLPSIIITLSLVAVLVGLVLLVRTGTHTAWLTAIGLESIYLIFGLFRFATSRYLAARCWPSSRSACCSRRRWPEPSAGPPSGTRASGNPSWPTRRAPETPSGERAIRPV